MTYFFLVIVVVCLAYFGWQAFLLLSPDVPVADVKSGGRREAFERYEWLRSYLKEAGELEARRLLNESALWLFKDEQAVEVNRSSKYPPPKDGGFCQ